MIIKNTSAHWWSTINEQSHSGLMPTDDGNPMDYYLSWYLRDYKQYDIRGEWFYDNCR